MAGIASDAVLVQVTDATIEKLQEDNHAVLAFDDGERSLILQRVEGGAKQNNTPDRSDTIGVQ